MGEGQVGLQIPVGLCSRLGLVRSEAPSDPPLDMMGEGDQQRE